MRTGLTKREKTTAIYFDEYGSMIEVQTHNTNLKKRLTAFAAEHPQCCRQIDDDTHKPGDSEPDYHQGKSG